MTEVSAPSTAFRRERRADERVCVLGCEMDLVRPEEVMHQVARAVTEAQRYLVANHNLHSLALYGREPDLKAFYEAADVIEVDSTPILAWARLTQGRGRPFHRCTYLDWRDLFWSMASQKGWRVFYLGAAPGVAQAAAEKLRVEWPGAVIAVRDGYFDLERDADAVCAEIAAFKPDILFVGMGMPRQERFVATNLEALPACAIFTVGAAFDYEAGVQRAAPRWMGKVGLEWLFRLLADPKRLFHRYCIEPWSLAGPALRDLIKALKKQDNSSTVKPDS